MKIIIAILSVLGLALIVFNATKVDVNNPFEGESALALITMLTALCAVLLLQILRISKRIESHSKKEK